MKVGGRRKFIMGTTAVIIIAALTTGTLVSNLQKAEAANPTLEGIEKIVSENSASRPFNILEIVPSSTVTVSGVDTESNSLTLKTGTIGYLISGNEPVNIPETLKTFKSSQARREFMSKMGESLSSIVSDEEDKTPLYGVSYNETLSELASASGNIIIPEGVQMMTGIGMESVSGCSGTYTKKFINPDADGNEPVSANEFFLSESENAVFRKVSDNSGDFDPNFILSSDGEVIAGKKYGPSFEADKSIRRGAFVVTDAEEKTITPGYGWDDLDGEYRGGFDEGTRLYRFDEAEGIYVYQGRLTNVSGKIAIKKDDGTYITSMYTRFVERKFFGAEPVEKEAEEAAEGTASGNNGTEGEAKSASDDKASPEDKTVSANEAVSGNEGQPSAQPSETEEAARGAEKYCRVVFKYKEAYDDSAVFYRVKSYEEDENGEYGVSASLPMAANVHHKGCIENITDSSPCICFEKEDYGNYIPVSDPSAGTIYVKNAEICYYGGFTNNEWFKHYVLDRTTQDEYNSLYINVYTVSAASISISDLENADLIYVSAYTEEFLPDYPELNYEDYSETRDISRSLSRTLLYMAAMRSMPVIVDFRLVKDGENDPDLQKTNIWKTAKILTAVDIKSAYNAYVSSYSTDGINYRTYPNGTDIDGTWVNNSVYIFNDFSNPAAFKTTVNRNFKNFDTSNKSYINDGLKPVLDEINDVRAQTGKNISTDIHEGTIIRYILNRSRQNNMTAKGDIHILEIEPMGMDLSGYDQTALRKIGVDNGDYKTYRGQTYYYPRIVPVELKYNLDVRTEGSGDSKRDILVYTKYDAVSANGEIPSYDIVETNGKITIDKMSIQEFIGKIDDLNSTYDMIFIGDDASGLNHERDYRNDVANSRFWFQRDKISKDIPTEYNDRTMDGLIYSNVGDYVYFSKRLLGSLESEYNSSTMTHRQENLKSEDDYKGEDSDDPDTTIGRSRLPGNDIRRSDITRLYEFAKADYPLVVGDMLISDNSVNTKRKVNDYYVDNASHLYQMLKKVIEDEGTSDNFFLISDLKKTEGSNSRKRTFVESLQSLKPEIYLISPTLNSSGMGPELGSNMIEIKFRIDDTGSGKETTYNAHFYTDLNADGKYSYQEETGVNSLRIYDSDNNIVESTSLRIGNEYKMIVMLNESASGVFPWKLSVVQNANSYRRDCIIGYSTKKPDVKQRIKVLQIGTDSGRTSGDQKLNLDIETKMGEYKQGKKTAMGYYLSNIPDYVLEVTTVTSDEFINDTVTASGNSGIPTPDEYRDEMRKYDMVIVGFADMYQWGSSYRDEEGEEREKHISMENNAAEGLLEYIAEGNSVLFSHDTTSYYNMMNYPDKGDQWGYSLNQYIRSVVGMNRYGIYTEADNAAKTNKAVASLLEGQKDKEHKDSIYQPRSNPKGEEDGGKSLISTQSQGATHYWLSNRPMEKNRNNWPIDVEDMRGDANYSGNRRKYDSHTFARLAYSEMWHGKSVIDNKVYVDCVNRGQITQYPYVLPDSFLVTNTHAQYWQLNLDIDDDRDGETDVVVWYTLGERPVNYEDKLNKSGNDFDYVADATYERQQYHLTGKDVRDNYFIYNRGNVTYTGQGHQSMVDGDSNYSSVETAKNVDECKLLVNTIIAAYSAGTTGSKVFFHETGNTMSRRLKSDIIPYDMQINIASGVSSNEYVMPGAEKQEGSDVSTMTSYIELSDTNIVYTKKIYGKFFLDDNTAAETVDGSDLHDMQDAAARSRIISITPLTDDGNVAAGYRDVYTDGYDADKGYLLYDSTRDNVLNSGKMFKIVYSIDGLKVDNTSMAVSNMPGIEIQTTTDMQVKRNGLPVTKKASDNLALIRTQLFNLK